MSIMSQPNTPYTNIAVDAKAIGQVYTSIKVQTPNTYHKDRSKL
jgi:hypothetical protein